MGRKKHTNKMMNSAMVGLLTIGTVLPGTLFPFAKAAEPTTNHIVISEVYGGGGSTGTTYKKGFIELYNPTNKAVNVDGWTVQYASKTGKFATASTQLKGTIAPKSYYLVQEGGGTNGTTDLPTPDMTGNITMSASGGKVALVKNADPATDKTDVDIVDFVGYGAANEFEGAAPTAAPAAATSVQRKDVEVDTNDNSVDFEVKAPEPQNSSVVKNGIGKLREVDADGKPTQLDQTVTVNGVVAAGYDALGKGTLYLQDATGGINVFGSVTGDTNVYKAGDRLQVTGKIAFYNGLTELIPTTIEMMGPETAPAAKSKTIAELTTFETAEKLEGSLVKFTAKATSVPKPTGKVNLTFQDADNKTITVRVDTAKVDITGIVQGGTYEVTGVLSQFDSTAKYDSGYQILPRTTADLVDMKPLTIQHDVMTSVYKGNDVKFVATATGADTVTTYYRAKGTTDFTALPMTKGTDNYSAVLASSAVPAAGFEYYMTAVSNTGTKTVGSSAAPLAVTVVDDTQGPTAVSVVPEKNAKVEEKRPAISVFLKDDSGLNTTDFSAAIDGADVTAQAQMKNDALVITPEKDLPTGVHTVKATVKDKRGNASTIEWAFETTATFTGGNHYRGTTHNHTNISHDGAGNPEDAVKAAKKYGYDFFAFTDHSHDIDAEQVDKDTVDRKGQQERTGGTEWKMTKKVSDENTKNGQFVVFPAFEMTSTTWGHSNVFGTDNFIDRKMNGGKYQDLNNYYAWVLTYDNIVAQFNHPGMPETSFNKFMPYRADVNQLFKMLEVGNGSGNYGYVNKEDSFFGALDLGWKVAPTYGEDNHDGTWGQTNVRTVVVAKDLSRDSLLDSMKKMRVYMSEDPNAQIDFSANGKYMGSTVDGKTLNFSVDFKDSVAEDRSMPQYDYLNAKYKSDDRVKKVELLTNGSKVVDSYEPMTKDFTWKPKVNVTGQQWFVVRVTQMDGERTYSAPIWSAQVADDVKVSDLTTEGSAIVADNAVNVQAAITNLGSNNVDTLNVKFYYDEVKAANMFGSTTITNFKSNTVQSAKVQWAKPVAGEHKLIVVIDAPGTDNPSDNTLEKAIKVKKPLGLKVMVDAAHNNENTSTDTGTYKNNLTKFTQLVRSEGYELVENTQPITAETLKDVKVLVITQQAGAKDLTDAENQAVSDFVKNGGSLLVTGKSNFKNPSTINNDLLEKMGATIRISDDQVNDDSKTGNFWNDPLKSKFSVRLHPKPMSNYITDRVSILDYYSGASLFKAGNEPLKNSDTVTVLVAGNETTYQSGVNGGYTYDAVSDATGGSAIATIASEKVGKGKIIVSGMNVLNDKQMDEGFEPKGNDEFALNTVNWLADRGTVVSSVKDARKLPEGTPIVIEGTVTTDAKTFFDAFYVQDETGGIFAFKELPTDTAVKLGDKVRVYGKVSKFEGDLELQFDKFNQDVIKIGEGTPLEPKTMTTKAATETDNQGQLVKVKGKVISKYDDNSYRINDGSGELLVFTDGYIANRTGAVPALQPGDYLEAVGLTSTFKDGARIRVRDTKELKKVTAPTEPGTTNPGTGTTNPGTGTTNPGTGTTNPGTGTTNPGTGTTNPGTGTTNPTDPLKVVEPAKTDEKKGNLPDTATTIYTGLAAGIILLLAGSIVLYRRRKA